MHGNISLGRVPVSSWCRHRVLTFGRCLVTWIGDLQRKIRVSAQREEVVQLGVESQDLLFAGRMGLILLAASVSSLSKEADMKSTW